ncbi:type VII secretion integral membrane protein EccD [Streptomyces sp. NPDC002911]
MTESSVGGLCRLTIRAPDGMLDLAVPSDIAVADLLPVIVTLAGDGLEEAGIEHDGWVLQRLGGEPLGAEATPAALNLLEGETLLLRPGTEALPPVAFDNLVDAVSSAVSGLPHAWTPRVGRWTLQLAAAGSLLGCLAMLALPGDPLSRVVLSLGTALLALSMGSAAARVLDDQLGGVILALPAIGFIGLSGAVVVAGPAYPYGRLGAALLAFCVLGAVGAAVALAVVPGYPVVFVALAVVLLSGAAAAILMLSLDVTLSRAAAPVTVLMVIMGAYVPVLSFSLAGLRLPPLPTNAAQLQEGIEPHTSGEVAARSAATDHWMTGLFLAIGIVCTGCLTAMAVDPDTPRTVTSLLLIVLLALHSRNLGTSWQRLALLVPALLGLTQLIASHALGGGGGAARVGAAVLLALSICLCVFAWTIPGRRMIPHWARAGDLLQSAAAIALLPMVLWVLGVYQMLRAVNG